MLRKLNRKNILLRTHYGLQIYAYILKQFYPDKALKLEGDTCMPFPNPYNNHKETLVMEIRHQLAQHWDLEIQDFEGDVFDFANLYFKTSSQEELYYMINQAMGLHLVVASENDLDWLLDDDSWKPQVSYFEPPIRNTIPSESLDLWELYKRIKGDTYKDITLKLRRLGMPRDKRDYKSDYFPYVTFSGTFRRRNDKAVIRDSGLMVFDFDDLEEPESEKTLLLNDEYFDTEMLFVSPSGKGLKWVIRHDLNVTPSRTRFFRGVANYLEKRHLLVADPSGKDLSRACYLAHDPDIFLHPRHRRERFESGEWKEESGESEVKKSA